MSAIKFPEKLCRDCRFYIPARNSYGEPLCGRDEAIKLDFVQGNHSRNRCGFMRLLGKCKEDAKLFEPITPGLILADALAGAVPVEAPADVVARLSGEPQ